MKKLYAVIGVTVMVAALAFIAVSSAAAADDDPPVPPFGGFGGAPFGMWGGGGNWEVFDAAAEALGMTPTELFEALHSGSTLAEVAEAQGLELEDLQEELASVHQEAARQRIQQAVENGDLSREQADWMLEGMDSGFAPFGRGPGRHQRLGVPNS